MSKVIDKKTKNRTMVQLAFFSALIVVLQLIGTMLVRVGAVAPALAPIPLVIGCIIFGYKGALILGSVFGFITLICGITGFDAFTNHMFQFKPLETAAICFGKAIIAALLGVIVYKITLKIFKGSLFPSTLAISIIVPVINTSIYLIGMASFFRSVTMPDGTAYFSFGESDPFFAVISAMFMMVIINFVMEVIVTPVCCTAISTVLSKSKKFEKMFIK